jgi:DNA (cytosine-5)-methyltransferase 1
MRAIDLYAGIGGWSLGLKLAGIDVVASYEWWQPAIDTHNGNHGGSLKPVDIRKLDLADLPKDIDLVVGSPPCTEFSYANRGGNGNIAEGMKDLVKFFEVVDHLKPKFWAMENVPRVAEVLRQGFGDPKHALYRFRDLKPQIEVFDFSEFGAPQSRKRCIAGNIPFDRVKAYRPKVGVRTLGDVVSALATDDEVIDPVWGVRLETAKLTETQTEPPLNAEELRMNRESKEFHPVYNNMSFPDPMDHPARTVTATCTRVSRESIVIADPKNSGSFRRLSIRERGCLQGFPITYQFYARSFSEKAKMVGNAIPPTFTYLLAQAAQDIAPEDFVGFEQAGDTLKLPRLASLVTPPDKEGRTYPTTRSFKAALPNLRFKSGMRFELANTSGQGGTEWKVRFFFGSSQDIRWVDLDGDVRDELRSAPLVGVAWAEVRGALLLAEDRLRATDADGLQAVWTHRASGMSPFDLTDLLGDLADALHARMEAKADIDSLEYVKSYVLEAAGDVADEEKLPGRSKLEKYALRIVSGFVVGSWFNTLTWPTKHSVAA